MMMHTVLPSLFGDGYEFKKLHCMKLGFTLTLKQFMCYHVGALN